MIITLLPCGFILYHCKNVIFILCYWSVVVSKKIAIILCYWSVVGVEIFCHHFMLWVCRGCEQVLPSFYVMGLLWVSTFFVIILCYGSVAGVVEVLSSTIFRCHGFCAITFIPVHWTVWKFKNMILRTK